MSCIKKCSLCMLQIVVVDDETPPKRKGPNTKKTMRKFDDNMNPTAQYKEYLEGLSKVKHVSTQHCNLAPILHSNTVKSSSDLSRTMSNFLVVHRLFLCRRISSYERTVKCPEKNCISRIFVVMNVKYRARKKVYPLDIM